MSKILNVVQTNALPFNSKALSCNKRERPEFDA